MKPNTKFVPASEDLATLVGELARVYREKPVRVLQSIYAARKIGRD